MSKPYNIIHPTPSEFEAFGNNLKTFLRTNGVTNKELGNALDLSDQTISDYLNWFENKNGKQPFWVPMLKLIKYLEQNTGNFNLYDLIIKRYTQTFNINDIILENKPRLKKYKQEIDELTVKNKELSNVNKQILEQNKKILDKYKNYQEEKNTMKRDLEKANNQIENLKKELNIANIKIKKIDKERLSLIRKLNKSKLKQI